jgi:hypothetical protein
VLVLTAGLDPRVDRPELVIGTVHKPFDIALLLDIVKGFFSSAPAEVQAAETVELPSPN